MECLKHLHCSKSSTNECGPLKTGSDTETGVVDSSCAAPQHSEQPQLASTSKQGKRATFRTRTSHWVRSNKASRAAYHLFKVKRWYLLDENLLFDPLRTCETNINLNPRLTLWRDHESDRDGGHSVDGILNMYLQQKQIDAIKKLDEVMEPLQSDVTVQTTKGKNVLFSDLMRNISSLPSVAAMPYRDFVRNLTRVMQLHSNGYKLPEMAFEQTFMKFVECLASCIGGSHNDVRCDRNVYGCILDKVVLPVKTETNEVRLEISSRPDLFLYLAADKDMPVLGVTEVKGLMKDDIVHSDDDDQDSTQCIQHPTKAVDDEEDKNEEEEEEDVGDDDEIDKLGKPIYSTPKWLDKISNLPPQAVKGLKAFLPQLIGEMMCCARSKDFRPLVSEDGLLFGIGLVGFDVYFISMIDSCRGTSKSVVNSTLACTQVFVTRPFDIKNGKDRRIIMKTLVAAFRLFEALS